MPIYLISDPPHLLKTACNCVRSSRSGGARMMMYNQHFILWEHFCHVPYLFESSELRSCKLTDSHFSHKSYAKMRVCYAAQLLSGTVSSLMKSRGGEEMKMSAWFAGLMNKWFDLMNTRLNYLYIPDLKPYTTIDDPRLKWLNTFLSELKQWKSSLTGSVSEQSKQFLSHQTYDGLVSTSMAIVELVKFLLENSPEGSYVLTKRLNQDPLEAYFGHMRQTGRRNEVPDIHQYAQFENVIMCKKNIKSLKGSNVNHVIDWKHGDVCDDPMPKRKK
ncbi:unnamed protein product [Clavelina lepadiformis]|uniref:Transposable element P transposase-like GTP-binding insertion domain-containing protein n=1 Tax=Clavelina lepadiformis TaxID=159417 RepID=A0ABP0GF97_CLALP